MGDKGELFADEVRAARANGFPIVMVHENDETAGGCEFARFFETTPQALATTLPPDPNSSSSPQPYPQTPTPIPAPNPNPRLQPNSCPQPYRQTPTPTPAQSPTLTLTPTPNP